MSEVMERKGEMPSKRTRFVIIGAGPTGLGAATHLAALGETSFLVIEAGHTPGGLASSHVDKNGFSWDLGPHPCYSHYEYYDRHLDSVLCSDDWITHERRAWIWSHDRFLPYPFQHNLHRLPNAVKRSCVRGLLDAGDKLGIDGGSFKDWAIGTFGKGIAEHFMLPYNEKIWAYPLDQMDAGWIRDRVPVPALQDVLRSIRLDKDDGSWGPNASFRYPRRGGVGAIWEATAARIVDGQIRYDERVVSVDVDKRIVASDKGGQYKYDFLISTTPLDGLMGQVKCSRSLPGTEGLVVTRTHLVGIGLQGPTPEAMREKLWIYYPDSTIPFYRASVMSRFAADAVPRPGVHWSLLVEVSESPFRRLASDDLVSDVIDTMQFLGLTDEHSRVSSRWQRKLSYGYPVPTRERDDTLNELLPILRDLGVYSRGRFGAWKYEVGNQDHSFMQGVEAIEHITAGRRELTVESPDLVNSRHNTFPYVEWAKP